MAQLQNCTSCGGSFSHDWYYFYSLVLFWPLGTQTDSYGAIRINSKSSNQNYMFRFEINYFSEGSFAWFVSFAGIDPRMTRIRRCTPWISMWRPDQSAKSRTLTRHTMHRLQTQNYPSHGAKHNRQRTGAIQWQWKLQSRHYHRFWGTVKEHVPQFEPIFEFV